MRDSQRYRPRASPGRCSGRGWPAPAQAAGAGPQTRAHALTAMEGEAFAHATYLAYGAAGGAHRRAAHRPALRRHGAHRTVRPLRGRGRADRLRRQQRGQPAGLDRRRGARGDRGLPGLRRAGPPGRLCPQAVELFTELAADEAVHAARFRVALEALTDPGSGVRIPVGEAVPRCRSGQPARLHRARPRTTWRRPSVARRSPTRGTPRTPSTPCHRCAPAGPALEQHGRPGVG